jgi:hypothetical protein
VRLERLAQTSKRAAVRMSISRSCMLSKTALNSRVMISLSRPATSSRFQYSPWRFCTHSK